MSGMVDGIAAKIAEALPGITKLKVRSSANAEDLSDFDGAGLYDSFSARTNVADNADGSCAIVGSGPDIEVAPRTLSCAIKAVYASVWNRRAIDERSFARVDHGSSLMGLAIVPKYDLVADIAANSVVVTRVINSNGTLGYTFSNQEGDNLVTNPTPGTSSEVIIVAFSDPGLPPSFVTTRHATPEVGGPTLTTSVYTPEQLQTLTDITTAVEHAYCQAIPDYYQGDCGYVAFDGEKPRSLDMELKFLANGQFLFKQVREFAGR
jgi:hypothetical protein